MPVHSIFAKAGQQFTLNEPWQVPEGVICAESLSFSSESDGHFYSDDLKITSESGTSGIITEAQPADQMRVFP